MKVGKKGKRVGERGRRVGMERKKMKSCNEVSVTIATFQCSKLR